ncbi:MAG: hypothetical protein PHI65_04645 [Firmicutes bacterium]|nr:hypothetical protein [Bacillota bacterium]
MKWTIDIRKIGFLGISSVTTISADKLDVVGKDLAIIVRKL